MSNSSKPRIVRKNFPKHIIKRGRHREVWPLLEIDFEGRCAYSLQHWTKAGGKKCLEVDHFDPKQKPDLIQDYANLFPATRHCNGAKRDMWPSNTDQRQGMRFLNCCKESDYGVHIFEIPDSHELFGVTPQGKYHIRACDLNAPHLIEERKERTRLLSMLYNKPVKVRKAWPPPGFDILKETISKLIPQIPFLTGEPLKKYLANKAALAS